ncbi:MAG: rRNA maturation RNase YbeY [Planctomycetes bacterium]|nr:rRNA maturation RNase YbeY [Planctomycetota bacterium]
MILRQAEVERAIISLAVVDDPTIHELNRRFLAHDYATDVLSFALDDEDDALDGEVIVSADTAATTAERLNVRPEDELLLYVVHGTLHLVGYDDLEPELKTMMRRREREVLAAFDVAPVYEDEDGD